MLTYYYDSKNASYSSGSYYIALESNRLSDEVFARLTVTNELVTLLTDHFEANISPEAVSQYAKSNGYVCASHILISKDKDNAYKTIKEIETKLKNGEDFDVLADKYGKDPGMKNRPDGYVFTKGFMVKEFEDAVFALKEGQISGVVTTDYGYHIIRRNAITSENITSGPEYSMMASEASVKFFSSEADKLVSSFHIDYAYNFDNLISVID
jgi:foldase protein PrsA